MTGDAVTASISPGASAKPSAPVRRGPYAKSARRRQEIIDAATTVFASRGYHGGSLRDIARQIEMSLTSVVHHFPTKTELLEAVLENADRTSPWAQAPSLDSGTAAAVLDLVRFNLDRPELLRLLAILASEASAPDHPAHQWFVDRYRRITADFARFIRHDQDAGLVASDVNIEDAARAVIAAWDGFQLQWLLDPTQDMAVHMANALRRLLPVQNDSSAEGQ